MQKLILTLTILCFFITSVFGTFPVYARDFVLPAPGVRVNLSPQFNPPILKGIKVHPDNPLRFDFILDQGDEGAQAHKSTGAQEAIKSEATRLIKYFLASLTIPEKDLWVNLSPYEKDRIIPQSFGLTEMGRDLLAEDYMLKQITASLIYPEGEIGKKFWKRIYEEAAKKFGTTNIPVNTFNKVWIVPEKAVVYENAKAGTAYVVEAKLKVMLEEDYLSLSRHSEPRRGEESLKEQPPGSSLRDSSAEFTSERFNRGPQNDVNALGSQIVREIVIPELTKEVNEGKNFAKLRQVYNSLILATWYRKKIKDSILEQIYADKNKVAGVNIDDPQEKKRIYEKYLQAFKKGVYDYIKEDVDPTTQERIPRKYFSGGVDAALITVKLQTVGTVPWQSLVPADNAMEVDTFLNTAKLLSTDRAMMTQFGTNKRLQVLQDILNSLGTFTSGITTQPVSLHGTDFDGFVAYGKDQLGNIPFTLSQDGLRFFKELMGLETIDEESYLITFASTRKEYQEDLQKKDLKILPFGILLKDSKTKKAVFFDFINLFFDFLDYDLKGFKTLGPFYTKQKIAGVASVLIGPDLKFEDIDHIALFREQLYSDHGAKSHTYAGDIFNILRVTGGYTSLYWHDRSTGEPPNRELGIFSAKDPFSDDFRKGMGEAGMDFFKGKSIGIIGVGSGIDLINVLHLGASAVVGNDISFVYSIFSHWNKRLAYIEGKIPMGSPADIKYSSKGGFDGIPDSDIYLFNAPFIGRKALVNRLREGRVDLEEISNFISVEDFIKIFEALDHRLKMNPKSKAIIRIFTTFRSGLVELTKEQMQDIESKVTPQGRGQKLVELFLEKYGYKVTHVGDPHEMIYLIQNDHAVFGPGGIDANNHPNAAMRAQRPRSKGLQGIRDGFAMLKAPSSKKTAVEGKNGGIDFTASKTPLEVQNSGKGIRFHLDPAMLKQLQNAPGFVPVIINIQPLKDLKIFLGVPSEVSTGKLAQ